MTDATAKPHGGERLDDFSARVAGWLDGESEQAAGCAVAITHAGVIKAAVAHALGAPVNAVWRIDVAPLSVTELHAHDQRWTIERVNLPLDAFASAA